MVTPAYKAARFIEATIRSVLDQGYPNLEFIVLDGAGDETAEILRRYDTRLAFWRSSLDDGQYAAITEGLNKATGEIVCWLNADDMLLPGSLYVVGEIFAQMPTVEWLSTLKPAVWDANGSLAHVGAIAGFSKAAFLDGNCFPPLTRGAQWIQQESTFFRRGLWQRAGGSIPPYGLAGDFALWCEFFKSAELYGVDYPLAGFRVVAGQRSEAMDLYTKEAQDALRDFREHEGWNRSLRAILLDSHLARLPKIRQTLEKSIGYHGKRIGNINPRAAGAGWSVVDYRFIC